MEHTVEARFTTITKKINQLVQQTAQLKKENEQLTAQLSAAKSATAVALSEAIGLQEQLAVSRHAATPMTQDEKKAFDKKINSYIKEIDNCINLLSR